MIVDWKRGCRPEVDAGRGCQEWMRCQIWRLGGGVKDGCSRRDQKWMLEPELDALREEGLNNTTKGRRLPRNELAQTAGFTGRDAFRVKAAET